METNKELDIARFIVEKTDCNLFLTGKAGTGKTTFLRDVKRFTSKKHIVLAPTGVAAVNAGGMTIHSFFQFGFGPYVKGVYEPEPNYHINKQKLELIRSLELIIIDEISMVRADLLDHINDELQRIRRNVEPFGGVQLLMIGDLQQLPPIAAGSEGEILGTRYPSMYFFDSFALRNSDYHCIELKSVYRQTDQLFIEILNRARVGQLTKEDISQLNSRYIPMFTPRQGENYIRLVTHNDQADVINNNELAKIQDNQYIFDATVSSGFPKDSFPTSEHLELKRNAQVMFIKNDPEKRFVNGSLGVVESVNGQNVNVKLSDTGEIVEVKPVAWESIRYKLNEETKNIEAEVKGTFRQYPLKTAWAITIHKSQGLTFDKAEIDVHKAFSPGQAYVALSRCRSLDGIVLNSPVTNSVFITDGVVEDYMRGAVQDIDALADNIGYEYFDYDRSVPEEKIAVKSGKKNEPIEVINKNVFEALKAWRLNVSRENNLPAYCIIADKTMASISNLLPESNDELLCAYGMGAVKIEKYGNDILTVVRDSRNVDNTKVVVDNNDESKAQYRKEPRTAKIPTWEITYQLFREGKSVAEIAQERSLVESTILSHLSRYVASGEIDVHLFISDDCLNKVKAYKRAHPDVTALKDIFEYYNETIPYVDIRMALAYIDKQ